MKSEISPSIIMRVKDFGESDLLVSFFTRDKGRLKGIAKGARKSRKRFPNCLDIFCLTSMEYELKRRGDLHFLHSCKLINAFAGLRSDFGALSLASYMIELTEILFPLGVKEERIFGLLESVFRKLEESGSIATLRILFEARAMCLGGYGIDFQKCCFCGRPYVGEGKAVFYSKKGGIACLKCGRQTAICPGLSPESANLLKFAQKGQWEDIEKITISQEAIQEIRPVIDMHMEYRIGRKLKTTAYLA